MSLLNNEIVTIYSQVVDQPSGIRRFWFGVSLLSPLRPILRNGNPLLKFLGNAFTGERILRFQKKNVCIYGIKIKDSPSGDGQSDLF